VGGGVQSEFQHGVLVVRADGSVVVTLDGEDAGVPQVVVVSEVDAGLAGGVVAAPAPAAEPRDLAGVVGGCSASGGAAWALGLLALLRRRGLGPTSGGQVATTRAGWRVCETTLRSK
jgi:hypothetical protein